MPVHAPVPTRCVSPAAVRLALIQVPTAPTVRILFNNSATNSLPSSLSLPLLAVTHPSQRLQEWPDDSNMDDVVCEGHESPARR